VSAWSRSTALEVVKGGRRFSFTALVVVGDEVDRVGVGYGRARGSARDLLAVDDARKTLHGAGSTGRRSRTESLAGSTPRACSWPGLARYRRDRRGGVGRCSSSADRERAGEVARDDEPDQHAEAASRRCASCAAPRKWRRRAASRSARSCRTGGRRGGRGDQEPTVVKSQQSPRRKSRRSWRARACRATVAEGLTTSDAKLKLTHFVARSASRSATAARCGRSAWAGWQDERDRRLPGLKGMLRKSVISSTSGEDLVAAT